MLLVFNLLVLNDFTSVLGGAEAYNIYQAQQTVEGDPGQFEQRFRLPAIIFQLHYKEVGFDLFVLRLPQVFLLILTLLGFYWWGKKLFGLSTVFMTLLVISSTFLVVTCTKFVGFDVWLVAFQLTGFTSLVLFLKQPIWNWRLLFWVATLGAVLVEPASAFVYAFGMWLFFVFAHPKGRNLIGFYDIFFWIVIICVAYFNGGFFNGAKGLFFHYSQTSLEDYFLVQLVGMLPWIAFLPAALADLIRKLRDREEMAIILSGFFFFSLFSFGLILQFAFALLIAKQVEYYFKPNYPYANLVKSVAVLNLIVSFFLVAVLLLTGYESFGAIGFRSRMGIGGVYWAFTFISVIGLFGQNKKIIIGSMTLAGMLTMLLFWTQIQPLLENYRNFPSKLVNAIEQLYEEEKAEVYLYLSSETQTKQPERTEVYLKGKNIIYEYVKERNDLENKSGILVVTEAIYSQLDSTFINAAEQLQVTGRSDLFGTEMKSWILKKND